MTTEREIAGGFWAIRVQALSSTDNDIYYGPFASQEEAKEVLDNDATIQAAVEEDCDEAYLVYVNNLVPGKRMVEYDQIAEGYKYEHNPEECDPTQATTWVLHMNVRPELVDAVLERMSELPDTNGFYGYGDSFQAWGETSDGDHDKHLAIYFKAEPARAHQIGMHLWAHATVAVSKVLRARAGDLDVVDVTDAIAPHSAVSTAGDFAEQIEGN